MTLLEASKFYDISYDNMALYEQNGLILGVKTPNGSDYSESEIKKSR